MKLPHFDGRDGLVVVWLVGFGATINGLAMLLPALAWIVGGTTMAAWATWRLK